MKLTDYTGDNIDRLITVEMRAHTHGKRGIISGLYDKAREKIKRPLTLLSAEKLVDTIKPNEIVIITTGWVIPFWLPRGENDGNAGSIALARSISVGLKARIAMLTEESVVPVLESGCKAAGLRPYPKKFFIENPKVGEISKGVMVQDFPIDRKEAQAEAEKVLDELSPAAVISIEKAGRNEKGVYHSGQGNDITSSTSKVDYLVDEARSRGILTVGILDLGNEIGSGVIKDAVKEIVPFGAKCNCPCGQGLASIVETDTIVVTSCCNWGAFGLSACLAGLMDNKEVFHTPDIEARVLQKCIETGSLDGVTLTSELVVSGVPLSSYVHLLDLLRTIIDHGVVKYRAFELRP